jgi:hypothetical protein
MTSKRALVLNFLNLLWNYQVFFFTFIKEILDILLEESGDYILSSSYDLKSISIGIVGQGMV